MHLSNLHHNDMLTQPFNYLSHCHLDLDGLLPYYPHQIYPGYKVWKKGAPAMTHRKKVQCEQHQKHPHSFPPPSISSHLFLMQNQKQSARPRLKITLNYRCIPFIIKFRPAFKSLKEYSSETFS